MIKYPIKYQEGSSTFEDKPLSAVPKHQRDWHRRLDTFWKDWLDFKKDYPEYSKYKMPACSPYDEKTYDKYRGTARYQWLAKWAKDWAKYHK